MYKRQSIISATLTPFEDSHYFDPHGEQMRQAVNAWIRSSNAFDGVIDFDAALRDPEMCIRDRLRAAAPKEAWLRRKVHHTIGYALRIS